MSEHFSSRKRIYRSDKERREQILRLKDLHRGQRCFLIGNGPSLSVRDLDKLQGELTFACNNIYLAFPDTAWRPTYYTVSDPLAAMRFGQVIDSLELTKLFSDSVSAYLKDSGSTIWLPQIDYERNDDLSDFAFSFDLTKGVYHGATTLYIQLQAAFYMGIQKVYLLGVDFDYQVPAQISRRNGLGTMVEHVAENNHFHPDYR